MMKILVIRPDMMGDIAVMTSVLPGLAKKYPGAVIDFLANVGYDAALENNPYIHEVVREDNGGYDLVLRIDHANEWNAPMNAVHCRIAGVEVNPPELYFSDDELKWGESYTGCIALATTAGWVSRRYRHWPEVVTYLEKKFRVVQVDNGQDVIEGVEHPRIDVRHAMAVVNAAALYLGVDSLYMHVAAAVKTPAVLVMGATGAEIQYTYCATILRPHPYSGWGDARYALEGIEIPPELVIAEVIKKVSACGMVVQQTGENGEIVSSCTDW